MSAPASPHTPIAQDQNFVLPDHVAHCQLPLSCNPHWKEVGIASDSWLVRLGNLSLKKQVALEGLKGGLLAGMTYPDCGAEELRVCSDFLIYLFHFDNISDSMDDKGTMKRADIVMNTLYNLETCKSDARVATMAKDLWLRILPVASPGAKKRFLATLDLFFQAVSVQAAKRTAGVVMDLESYIDVRRDTSGCKPCFALIEYANHLDIPDKVMEHPILEGLGEAANDFVTWCNDIFSYDAENSGGDGAHNMITVVMRHEGVSRQEAVDFVGSLCTKTFDRFFELKRNLPSFGDGGPTGVDEDVARYVKGLEDWMVGSFHWSFESERYFGKSGLEVKKTGLVRLTPVDASRASSHSESEPSVCELSGSSKLRAGLQKKNERRYRAHQAVRSGCN